MKKIKKNKKKLTFKKVLKIVLRNLVYFLVGLVYLVILMLKTLNKLVVKAFSKLPTYLKVVVIYALVIGNIPTLAKVYETVKGLEISNQVEIKEVATNLTETLKVETTEEVEEVKKEKVAYNFNNEIESKIFNKSVESGLTEKQAFLLVAISKHETGNWTSKLFKENNNFGGLYNSKEEKFYSYNSFEEGLNAFVNLLKNRYFGKGLNTIEEIGSVYCPVGAKNDPNGLNKNWVPRVTQYYNDYLGNK